LTLWTDVRLRAEPARLLIAKRARVGSFDEARALLGEVARELPRRVSRSALQELVVIAHAPSFEPDDLDLELGFFVEREVTLPEGGFALSQLPAVPHMAVCVREGPPEEAHATTGAIARFVEERGYGLSGGSREVFLTQPKAGAAVVEMQFPVQAP
jgi:effector-binding domain-containing protein